MTEYLFPSFRYRCSVCAQVFAPEEIARHTEHERSQPGWQGLLTWHRVDHLKEEDQ